MNGHVLSCVRCESVVCVWNQLTLLHGPEREEKFHAIKFIVFNSDIRYLFKQRLQSKAIRYAIPTFILLLFF